MQRILGVSLAAAIAAHAAAASADPSTPQISPVHRHREDAQRLTEEQRGLGRDRPADSTPVRAPPPTSSSSAATGNVMRGFGVAFLGVAGVSALVALSSSNDDTERSALVVTSALTGVAGIVLIVSSRSLLVAPTVTSRAVGISLVGRI